MDTIILGFALTVIFGLITAMLIDKYHDALGMAGLSLAILSGTLSVMMLVTTLIGAPTRINTFVKQKAYIESVDFDEFQSAGITLAKVEQNGWLYVAQFTRERFGDWGPYPETVLDLEPIE